MKPDGTLSSIEKREYLAEILRAMRKEEPASKKKMLLVSEAKAVAQLITADQREYILQKREEEANRVIEVLENKVMKGLKPKN